MFCMNCGKQIQEGSNFCRFCGASQQPGGQTPTASVQSQSEPRWETCETYRTQVKEAGWSSQAQFVYVAQAIGPNGKYIAGVSPVYEGDDQKGLEPLINQLSREGWEYVGGLNELRRFRRLVTPVRLHEAQQRSEKEKQESRELFNYIRQGRIRLDLNLFGWLRIRSGSLRPETLAKIYKLYPYITELIKEEQNRH